jgi:hypothetical protein
MCKMDSAPLWQYLIIRECSGYPVDSGTPTRELVRASYDSPEGVVLAYKTGRWWRLVRPQDEGLMESRGETIERVSISWAG